MVNAVEGYELDVDRGPNWLFVRVHPNGEPMNEPSQIADELWSISSKHFIYRLVLELDQLDELPEGMMGQIVVLQQRLAQHGGALKLCGLSPDCAQALTRQRLEQALPNHQSRAGAVWGDSTLAM